MRQCGTRGTGEPSRAEGLPRLLGFLRQVSEGRKRFVSGNMFEKGSRCSGGKELYSGVKKIWGWRGTLRIHQGIR